MRTGLICILVLLTGADAMADAPLSAPRAWTTCSPSGEFCADLDPDRNMITAHPSGDAGSILWQVQGWSRYAVLADDGRHLVLGYGGLNLVPRDHRLSMTMLTFLRDGEQIATVPLRRIVSRRVLRDNETTSHYYWGDFIGIVEDGHFGLVTADDRTLHYDMTTGELVEE